MNPNDPAKRTAEHPKVTRWKAAFLRCLRQCGQPTRSAMEAGIDRPSAYRARKADPAFREAWDEALRAWTAESIERASAAVYRRGVDGYEEPVYQMGRQVGTRQRYDTRAALAWLAAHSARWQPTRRVQHSGSVALVPQAAQERLSDPTVLLAVCQLDAALTASEGPQAALPPAIEVEADETGADDPG